MIPEIEFKQLSKIQKDSLTDQLKPRLYDYLVNRCGIQNPLRGNFKCPICGHATMHFYQTSNRVTCFSGSGCNCEQIAGGKSYDLFDLIGKKEGISDFSGQLLAAANEFNIPAPTEEYSTLHASNAQTATPAPEKKINSEGIKKFVRTSAAAMPGSPAESYMMGRGFTPSFLEEKRIGYEKYYNAVVIPYYQQPDSNCDYYTMRFIQPRENGQRFYKLSGQTAPIFHAANITNSASYVFVCEAEIDALSVEQAGGNAVAICSTNNARKLIDYLEQLPQHPDKTFIIALDNDDAGRPAEKALIKSLTDLGYTAISANEAGLYDYTEALTEFEAARMKPIKDINDLLQGDPEALTARIEKMIGSPADVYRESYSMASFRSAFMKERERNSQQPFICTGFKNLDQALSGGLRPGLIFLGAITSIGKSTLVMQTADYIACTGKDVMFFALEMSQFELASRSISRESYRIAKAQQIPQPENASKYFEVADGRPLTEGKTLILNQAIDYYYSKIAPHIFIVEGEGDVSVDSIRQKVQNHAEMAGTAPVVIVDYLQLLQPPAGANRWSDKQIVDHNTIQMKHISRDFRTPVIGVLSLNRAAYGHTVDLSSGKESGSIEYGCDVLLGMNQERENEDGTRSVFIDILKNRSGMKDKRITFDYSPAYSTFKDKSCTAIPKEKSTGSSSTPLKKGQIDEDGFKIG